MAADSETSISWDLPVMGFVAHPEMNDANAKHMISIVLFIFMASLFISFEAPASLCELLRVTFLSFQIYR